MTLPAHQRLALRAALLAGDEGVAAWREWRATTDLETIDRGTARLLPLLWHNLLANGVADDWLPRFKGVYRHTWFANQVWMRRVRQVEGVLAGAGIRPVALKGIALAHGYYPNPGLRPMDDLDLLVAPDELASALTSLAAAGWRSSLDRPGLVLEVVHGVELVSAQDERLDLHGHLLQGSLHTALDDRRRARAIELALADGPLRTLEPTDQLLHVLVHGVESDPPAPRWLADALMILRACGDSIDWPRLLDDAEAESRLLAVAVALDQLRSAFGTANVALPAQAAQRLAGRRWSRGARFEQRVAAGPRLFAVGYLVQRLVDYRRWRRADTQRRTGFAGYLRLNWGLASLRQLPPQIIRRGLRTLAGDLARLAGRLRAAAPGAADQRTPG